MNQQYIWKKGFFDTTYRIFSDNKLVGRLTDNSFKQKATGNLNSLNYRFETSGFLNQNSVIIDNNTNKKIGTIVFNGWHTKATITLFNKKYHWQFNNMWSTKWSLYDNGKLLIDNIGGSTAGNMICSEADELHILTSLYITNYYWQSTLTVFIALIPIYIVLFS